MSILRLLYIPYMVFVVIPVLVVTTIIMGTLVMILVPITGPRKASLICGTAWARINSYVTPMLVTVRGREHADPGQSYVIISNHLSHYDIFVLYGWLGIDFKWVMKKELRKVPFLGFACDRLGHIYIDRSNHDAALKSLREARTRITGGTSVLFFPEGTRSYTGTMQEFKKGAFRMALDLDLPILPVTVAGTEKILPPRSLRLFPGKAELIIHPPVQVEEYSSDNLDELIQTCRRVVQSGLDERTPAGPRPVSPASADGN